MKRKNVVICTYRQLCYFLLENIFSQQFQLTISPGKHILSISSEWASLSDLTGACPIRNQAQRRCCFLQHHSAYKAQQALSEQSLSPWQAHWNYQAAAHTPRVKVDNDHFFQNITFGRTKQEQPLSELLCKIIKNIISTYSWNPIICMTISIFMFVCLSHFVVRKTAEGGFSCSYQHPAFWNESTYLFSWHFLIKT